MASNVEEFLTKHGALIRQAAASTGLPVSVVAAQWGLESGWGTSKLAREGLNLGGIRYYPKWGNGTVRQPYSVGLGSNGLFGGFASYTDFAADWRYILNIKGYGYPEVLRTAKAGPGEYATASEWADEVARALGRSAYDAGHYQGVAAAGQPAEPGGKLLALMRQYNLYALDAAAAPDGGFSGGAAGDVGWLGGFVGGKYVAPAWAVAAWAKTGQPMPTEWANAEVGAGGGGGGQAGGGQDQPQVATAGVAGADSPTALALLGVGLLLAVGAFISFIKGDGE